MRGGRIGGGAALLDGRRRRPICGAVSMRCWS